VGVQCFPRKKIYVFRGSFAVQRQTSLFNTIYRIDARNAGEAFSLWDPYFSISVYRYIYLHTDIDLDIDISIYTCIYMRVGVQQYKYQYSDRDGSTLAYIDTRTGR
jgi:hypothetical protein